MHAHAGTRVHEATSLTGLVPERVQLTVHTTEPTGTVPEPFHCDYIDREVVGSFRNEWMQWNRYEHGQLERFRNRSGFKPVVWTRVN